MGFPRGTIARGDLEGFTAFRQQIPELAKDIQSQFDDYRKAQSSSCATPVPTKPEIDLSSIRNSDFSLPKPDEVDQELKNFFRSTPKGLKTPKKKVLNVFEGEMKLGVPERIEIRSYESFNIATTKSMGGQGFNKLASYLMGENESDEKLQMTTPVVTT